VIGIDERPCDTKAVERAVATHEADMSALNGAGETEFPYQREVESWRGESCAGDSHEMGDVATTNPRRLDALVEASKASGLTCTEFTEQRRAGGYTV